MEIFEKYSELQATFEREDFTIQSELFIYTEDMPSMDTVGHMGHRNSAPLLLGLTGR